MSDTVTTADEADEGLSIFDICETDASAEEEGRWFRNIYGNETNIHVKLRRMTSKKSLEARRRLEKGFRKHMKNGQFSDEIMDRILVEHIAEAVLVDWENIKIPETVDGKKVLVPLPYSKEAAKMLLTKLPNFRNALAVMSNDMDNFRAEEAEELGKN